MKALGFSPDAYDMLRKFAGGVNMRWMFGRAKTTKLCESGAANVAKEKGCPKVPFPLKFVLDLHQVLLCCPLNMAWPVFCTAMHQQVLSYINGIEGKDAVMAGLNLRLELVNKHPFYYPQVRHLTLRELSWCCAHHRMRNHISFVSLLSFFGSIHVYLINIQR
jgi:hypothetical protein